MRMTAAGSYCLHILPVKVQHTEHTWAEREPRRQTSVYLPELPT